MRGATAYLSGLILIYALAVGGLLFAAGGPFAYPLDDTYIHLAMGRTLATTGTWGVDPNFPAAASSSPLWTLLLAGIYALHSGSAFLYAPLLLCVGAGIALIATLLAVLGREPASVRLVVAIAFAAAIPSLSVAGMEHVLHAVLALCTAFIVCRMIADEEGSGLASHAAAGLLAALAVAARYESLFLIAPLVVLSLARLRLGLATALALGASLPVVGFGLLWIHNGGWLLPNSLILKSVLIDTSEPILSRTLARLSDNLGQTVLVGGFGLLLIGLPSLLAMHVARGRAFWTVPTLLAVCAIVATLGHFTFASVGWLYRYEAWLIVLDLVALSLLAQTVLSRRGLLVLAASIVVAFSFRTWNATVKTAMAIDDRRVEHLAAAHFVERYHPGEPVMATDIGAIAWLAPQTEMIDIFGLANNEPIRMSRNASGYNAETLSEWGVRTGARIAIVQPCFPAIANLMPADWQPVATWRIPRNIVFGDRIVAFFAVAPQERKQLLHHLAEFPVPPGVEVRFEPNRSTMLEGCR